MAKLFYQPADSNIEKLNHYQRLQEAAPKVFFTKKPNKKQRRELIKVKHISQ